VCHRVATTRLREVLISVRGVWYIGNNVRHYGGPPSRRSCKRQSSMSAACRVYGPRKDASSWRVRCAGITSHLAAALKFQHMPTIYLTALHGCPAAGRIQRPPSERALNEIRRPSGRSVAAMTYNRSVVERRRKLSIWKPVYGRRPCSGGAGSAFPPHFGRFGQSLSLIWSAAVHTVRAQNRLFFHV